MEFFLRKVRQVRACGWLFLGNLLVEFHHSSVLFITSSFLTIFFTERVGLLYTAAALVGLLALSGATHVLARIGAYRTVLAATLLTIAACLTLAFHQGSVPLIVVAFTLLTTLTPIISFCLDVLLEGTAPSDDTTGNVRGMYLSVAMVAALLAPTIASLVAGERAAYESVFLMSGLFLIPFLAIAARHFRSFTDPVYRPFSFTRTLSLIRAAPDLRHIAVAQFLLRFYFAWMTVYLPLYLHGVIGFSWPNIGVILFIMLIPYVLAEWPAGLIADGWLGEQELLAGGFLLTGLTTLVLPFLGTAPLLVWGAALFATRIGTALIDSMTETYFFKHVHARDADIIGFFRMLRPLAYALGPLVATILLIYLDLSLLWSVLGATMLMGILSANRLRDTR